MDRYRYTALLKSHLVGTTRVYDHSILSKQEGLEGLESFFEARKKDFGDNLVSVALEKSQTGIEWEVVRTLPS